MVKKKSFMDKAMAAAKKVMAKPAAKKVVAKPSKQQLKHFMYLKALARRHKN